MNPVIAYRSGSGQADWVRTYPAPVCEACGIAMWLAAQTPGHSLRSARYDYCCGRCRATLRVHRTARSDEPADRRAAG
jgi:hypothetical protein